MKHSCALADYSEFTRSGVIFVGEALCQEKLFGKAQEMNTDLIAKAKSLQSMHFAPPILVLPNAWDVASARVFQHAGARAIATTSAGIAFTLGYRDGQFITRDAMLEVVARIAAATHVPVTADMESGYATTPEELAETTRRILQAGAVGFNLEDVKKNEPFAMFSMAEQIERIQAAREASKREGGHVVINARTDIFLAQIGDPENRLDETVKRLNAYRDAGADCLFAPGVTDAETIAELVRQVAGPLNILASAGAPTISELQNLGVARVSVGSGIMRASLAFARDAAVEVLEKGSYTKFTANTIPYCDLNELMK
jgi:2-methylisocitrate lyase-like PEP mutase family enzyme